MGCGFGAGGGKRLSGAARRLNAFS